MHQPNADASEDKEKSQEEGHHEEEEIDAPVYLELVLEQDIIDVSFCADYCHNTVVHKSATRNDKPGEDSKSTPIIYHHK